MSPTMSVSIPVETAAHVAASAATSGAVSAPAPTFSTTSAAVQQQQRQQQQQQPLSPTSRHSTVLMVQTKMSHSGSAVAVGDSESGRSARSSHQPRRAPSTGTTNQVDAATPATGRRAGSTASSRRSGGGGMHPRSTHNLSSDFDDGWEPGDTTDYSIDRVWARFRCAATEAAFSESHWVRTRARRRIGLFVSLPFMLLLFAIAAGQVIRGRPAYMVAVVAFGTAFAMCLLGLGSTMGYKWQRVWKWCHASSFSILFAAFIILWLFVTCSRDPVTGTVTDPSLVCARMRAANSVPELLLTLIVPIPFVLPYAFQWHWIMVVPLSLSLLFPSAAGLLHHIRTERAFLVPIFFTWVLSAIACVVFRRAMNLRDRRSFRDKSQLQARLDDLARALADRRSEKLLRKALGKQQKAQQDLMGFVCHELRAPLHAFKALVDELQQNDGMGEASEELEMMEVSATQMSMLIDDVLDLVTVTCGVLPLPSLLLPTACC